MPPKKKKQPSRSRSPVRKSAKIAVEKPVNNSLPYLSNYAAETLGVHFKTPKVLHNDGLNNTLTINWDQYGHEAADWLRTHNPEAYEQGEWDRIDLICYFIYIGVERRGQYELQFLLNFVTGPLVGSGTLKQLDEKILALIIQYNLDLPWLGRWLMFHTSHKIPFVTFIPRFNAWSCRYSSVLYDEGEHLENYFVYSFAKLPPLDIKQLSRPDPEPTAFWRDCTAHVMYEFNARITEHLAAFARQGFQAPVIEGVSCFDLFDIEQPGWRKNVENFEIKDGSIVPKK